MEELSAIAEFIKSEGWIAFLAILVFFAPKIFSILSNLFTDYFDLGEKKESTTSEAIQLASAIAQRFDQIESQIHENRKTIRSIGNLVVRTRDEIQLLRVSLEATQGFNRIQAQNTDTAVRGMLAGLDRIERGILLVNETLADTQPIEAANYQPE